MIFFKVFISLTVILTVNAAVQMVFNEIDIQGKSIEIKNLLNNDQSLSKILLEVYILDQTFKKYSTFDVDSVTTSVSANSLATIDISSFNIPTDKNFLLQLLYCLLIIIQCKKELPKLFSFSITYACKFGQGGYFSNWAKSYSVH